MRESLDLLKHIGYETREENRNLSTIAGQNQKDSKAIKVLTIIATMYLPASLIAVSGYVECVIHYHNVCLDYFQL